MRLNASSWRVRPLARSPAFLIFLDVGPQGVLGLELVGDEIGVAEDHRQDVVEVVGHAAGEPTNGLQLLRLQQLGLELLVVRLALAQRGLGAPALVDLERERGIGLDQRRALAFECGGCRHRSLQRRLECMEHGTQGQHQGHVHEREVGGHHRPRRVVDRPARHHHLGRGDPREADGEHGHGIHCDRHQAPAQLEQERREQ
ncbi:MAG: hypothetical protein IPH07_32590 [Deltaproteobacteria bacterium]|nr:hypothetical protein [Deltaproteobacteria bacterium]